MKRRIACALLALACVITALSGCAADTRETLTIAMPRGEYIRSMDTNYYKQWLEERTGLKLEFVYVDESRTAEYMDAVFSEGDIPVDVFFAFDSGEDYLSALTRLSEYGERGLLLPLDEYLDGTTNLEHVFSSFDSYDLRATMTSPDGKIYFMPGLDASRGQSVGQVLWLNKGWLSALEIPIPVTTEQLRETLLAFKTLDPNRNGLADEIPLAGSAASYDQQSYNAIINAFVRNDPDNSRLFVKDGAVSFAPMTEQWREAMKYLNGLYADGLLSPLQFELSTRSLSELASNRNDLLGGFTAENVTDVLRQNSPEVISGFTHVAPLQGPDGTANASVKTQMPSIAGVITTSCANPDAAFRLLDLMLTEEAFRIGRFGEEGVDWTAAGVTDMDFYGRRATIRVLNGLQNKMQNKHISELGPFFAYPEYADGVTFTGFESDQEYINARAHWTYEPYIPEERLGALLYTGSISAHAQALRPAIDTYTDECIVRFITGELDPHDDAIWAAVSEKFEQLGWRELVSEAQRAYTEKLETEEQG